MWGKSAPPDAPQIRKKFFPASQGKASRSRGGLNENESGRSGCVLPIHAAGDKFLSAALVIKMWQTENSSRLPIAAFFPAARSCSIFGNFIKFYGLCYVLPVYAHGALCTDTFSSARADLIRGLPFFHHSTHWKLTWPNQTAVPSVLKKNMGCRLCFARQY